jgi:hypothetical protein
MKFLPKFAKNQFHAAFTLGQKDTEKKTNTNVLNMETND